MGYVSTEHTLTGFESFVAAHMGLNFPRERWADLDRGLQLATHAFGFSEAEACLQWLMSTTLSQHQIETLASVLTVGETYFFREKRIFEVLKETILPALIAQRQNGNRYLRIWSAGCSTGEEPYSIAILLHQLIPNLSNWHITVLGTDINPVAMKKAQTGIYENWSFRDTPPEIKERYFNKIGKHRYEILPAIKKMVTINYLNLVEDTYPSLLNNTNAIDIIFCRNLLMYFSEPTIKNVINKFNFSLIDGGYLILGASETSFGQSSALHSVNFPGCILYKKGDISKEEKQQPISYEPIDFILPIEAEPLLPEYIFEPVNEELISEIKIPFVEKKEIEENFSLNELTTLYEKKEFSLVCEKLSVYCVTHILDVNEMTLFARALANQGFLKEALVWVGRAIQEEKCNTTLYYLQGMILLELRDIPGAMQSIKQTLYLDEQFILAHVAMGNLLRTQDRWKESEKNFKKALVLLSQREQEEVLPESDGMTVGRLRQMIKTTIEPEGLS